jgi:hypothetical protein
MLSAAEVGTSWGWVGWAGEQSHPSESHRKCKGWGLSECTSPTSVDTCMGWLSLMSPEPSAL